MIVSFYTLGCKLNQLETEALASSFRKQGFLIANGKTLADIYILNSCTVTSKSDQKGRKWIRSMLKLNPRGLVIATGCYAELEPDVLEGLGDNVLVLNQEDKALLLTLPVILKEIPQREIFGSLTGMEKYTIVKEIIKNLKRKQPLGKGVKGRFAYTLEHYNFHSRAFLKIQDGCDYRCSYCRVPLARGGSVSLDYERIIERIKLLESRGYREIVLTGVNISSYRYNDYDFILLLEKILASGVHERIRLSSIEPEKIDSRFGEIVSDSRICPHFHIPVQSFSDKILRLMRRRYNSSIFEGIFEILRKVKEDPFIAFDIIVGFPGETDEDFERTYTLIEEYKPAKVHVFPYSPRPGTDAFHYRHRVPERIRDERVQRIIKLSKELERKYRDRWVGKEVGIIVEDVDRSRILGVSENYLRIRVPLNDKGGIGKGDLAMVRIIRSGKFSEGVLIGDNFN